MDTEKIFFNPGQIVKIRHQEIINRPNMWVVEKASRTVIDGSTGVRSSDFIGIRCRWFDNNYNLCEGVFSSKDLEHV